jgi:hypothetical protein
VIAPITITDPDMVARLKSSIDPSSSDYLYVCASPAHPSLY